MEVKLLDLLNIYEKEIRKHTKNKRSIYNFDRFKMQNILEVKEALESNKKYKCFYNIFLIFEPKVRVVMALNIKDKLLNHYVTRFILQPKLEKYLDIRNVATRKNIGTDYGRKLILKYLEKNKKYKSFYILKLDIAKYFYSIDHEMLKKLLINNFTCNEYKLICNIIDSTNEDYINKKIDTLNKNGDLSFYLKGKGLPIGNMTSQFLSIFYLYKLDHKIVHDFKIKYYVRYMDDFILIDKDKNKLKDAYFKIKDILENEYSLVLNKKKTKLIRENEGFNFLGYNFKVINNKTICILLGNNKRKIRKRLNKTKKDYLENKITLAKAFTSIMTFWHNYKYGSKWYVRRWINKIWFYE